MATFNDDDMDFDDDDKRNQKSSKKRSHKERKYDPNMEMSFAEFCRLMGFDIMKLIQEEQPSLVEAAPQGQRKRSNSMSLPSYVPTTEVSQQQTNKASGTLKLPI